MCGLIGQASTEVGKFAAARRDAFRECLLTSVLRGSDATGIGVVRKGQEKATPEIFKKALAAPDFLQLRRFERYITDFQDYSAVLGHTRAATYGGKSPDHNAHPFQEGHITLTHNGHISNAYQLLPHDKLTAGAEVDSHRLTIAMARDGELETLNKAEGAFALVWHNSQKGTLNFARNQGRPLKFCFIKDQNTMFWASERLMLRWRLEENGLEVDGTYKNLVPGAWLEFDLSDLRKFKIHHFNQRPRTGAIVGRTDQSNQASGATSHTQTSLPKTSSGGTSTSNDSMGTHGRTTSVSSLLSYHKSVIAKLLAGVKVPEMEIAKRQKALSKSSGRPTKKKSIAAMTEQLRRFGLSYDQDILVTVSEFEPYKNQSDRLGAVSAAVSKRMYLGKFMNISRADFMDMSSMRAVLAKVVGVGYDKFNKATIFYERHPLYREYAAADEKWMEKTTKEGSKSSTLTLPKQEPKQHQLPDPDVPDDNGYDTRARYHGPSGRGVSMARFFELTKHGCGCCAADIPLCSHRDLLWTGDSPICLDCQTDPKKSAALGITKQ